jgi:pimeloyl-ACP methyl ester carboxylesterase
MAKPQPFDLAIPGAAIVDLSDRLARTRLPDQTPGETMGMPRRSISRWSVMPRGGHFAAREQPELLAHEVREFFRPLRV